MLFNSYGYLLFLLIAVPACLLVSGRARAWLMLGFSIAFYAMWRIDFALLVLFSGMVDYVASHRISATENSSRRRAWLVASLVINIGLLLFFKYTYFVLESASGIFGFFSTNANHAGSFEGLNIILPLGISFYTFQSISCTVDVYRKVIKPVKSPVVFLAYVMYWPQLIAGPILRVSEVAPQLVARHRPNFGDIAAGLERIFLGLFKKVVIADNLARFVDPLFAADPSALGPFDIWIAAILFGFQIYFDFSGYSDVAIGSARLAGVKFPENFNWPYVASSPKDFWRRWHISLSSWIRDYLYLPLTGRKFQTSSHGGLSTASDDASDSKRLNFALFTTWFIMGLWHGAGWNFALWGVMHAIWIYMFRSAWAVRALSGRVLVSSSITFAAAMLTWIPFRAESLDQSLTMLGTLANPFAYSLSNRFAGGMDYLVCALLIAGYFIFYQVSKSQFWRSDTVFGNAVRSAGLAVVVAVTFLYLRPVQQFIYFQF